MYRAFAQIRSDRSARSSAARDRYTHLPFTLNIALVCTLRSDGRSVQIVPSGVQLSPHSLENQDGLPGGRVVTSVRLPAGDQRSYRHDDCNEQPRNQRNDKEDEPDLCLGVPQGYISVDG